MPRSLLKQLMNGPKLFEDHRPPSSQDLLPFQKTESDNLGYLYFEDLFADITVGEEFATGSGEDRELPP